VVSRRKPLFPREHKKALIASAFFVSASFIVLLSISVLLAPVAQADCPRLPGGFSARVEHVYDGDTVRLADGRKVRLIGVNTPELGRDGRADEPHARAAKDWLQRQVHRQQVYLLPGADPRDRYGRLLAHLYLPDGQLAAEGLIRSGLGFALAVGRNDRLADCLFAAEGPAQQQQLALWRQAPLAAARVNRAGFALVQGRVTKITPTRRGLYIDLDQNLALFLPRTLLDSIERQEWQPGDRLQARGWISDRLQRRKSLASGQQRWLITLTHKQHLRNN
jgi:endonuclease YncB( thermonuclease family)